jgi:hypothetical protein
VEQLGDELDLGRLGGIFLAELKVQLEESSFPHRALWSFNEGGPSEKVIFLRRGIDAAILFLADLLKIFN